MEGPYSGGDGAPLSTQIVSYILSGLISLALIGIAAYAITKLPARKDR